MQRIHISFKQPTGKSEIRISSGVRKELGQLINESSAFKPRRVLLLSNKRVFNLYGRDVAESLGGLDLKIFEFLMPEGERHKSFSSLENAVLFLAHNRFERNDLVVALGGGVVGDLAGFASSVYLRGVPFIQIPTTLLAQIDSSVGGKTAINLSLGKNMVGTFYQPPLVLIDPETLSSLPQRELVAGFCEMVKQSLVANRSLFKATTKMLRVTSANRAALQTSEFESLIAAQCSFKAKIVGNDEREATDRVDGKSRRILNFGHTTAHALEAITNYRVFRHGEAVGYGMLVAGELSKNIGLLPASELELLREAVRLCGTLPRADNLDIDQILRSLQHDKKSLAGQINWVLLEKIGCPKIVPGREISAKLLHLSLRTGLQSVGRQKDKSH